ncbi:hypothetical protein DOT_4127 [Desulfosporosinus sp. OT]|nr:hypothetical protein DOT_4127 [Desulfosporosinus sp. OT]
MKQASCEVEVLFKKVFEQDSYPKSFEFTWNTYPVTIFITGFRLITMSLGN